MQKDIINRASGIPVYRQLAEHIKAQIIKGEYKPGDVLPSEAELIRDLNFSRATLLHSRSMLSVQPARGNRLTPGSLLPGSGRHQFKMH